MEEAIAKAGALIEAMEYIRSFRGKIVVVKLGGSVLDDISLRKKLLTDIAFMAMDLDFKGQTALSDFFVEGYVKYSGDQELRRLLPFYKCYRAYVRGKVTSFKLKDPHVGVREKEIATEEAKAYFKLASTYVKTL